MSEQKNGEVRIGVYVCHCGANIADTVDVKAVAEYAATLPGVVVARDYKYMCSDPGQELVQEDIRNLNASTVWWWQRAVPPCTKTPSGVPPSEPG
jgi:heterodisulfide reductase subunit A